MSAGDRMEDRPRQGFEGLYAVWSRRRTLALVAFVVPMAAVVAVASFLPDVYKATTTVIVEHDQVQESFVKASVISELETRIRTLSQEILSRARLKTLIDRFGLYPSMKGRASDEALVQQMRRDIQMEFKETQQPGTGRSATISFELSFQGRDPRLSAAVANTLAASYVEQNSSTVTRQTSDTTRFLKAQLDEMKVRHDEQERKVREFKMRHSGDLPEQMAPNLATLERLNTRLYMNRDNQQRVQERKEALLRGVADSGRAGLLTGSLDSGPSRITRLRQELMELKSRYSDQYPDVIRVKEELALLEKGGEPRDASKGRAPAVPEDPAVRRLEESARSLDNEIKILKAEEERLQESINSYQSRVDAAPQRDQEFRELSRDYEATKTMYASLLSRFEEAQIAENMQHARQGEQFRILDPAVPPKRATAPNRMQLVAIGALLSLALAAGLIVLAEQRDTSFHSVDDLRGLSRVPVLISIPKIVTRGDLLRRRARVSIGALAVALGMVIVAAAAWSFSHDNVDLVRLLARGATRSVPS